MEELVAELDSAFLSADLDLTPEPRQDHAAYIASWLKVLKNDERGGNPMARGALYAMLQNPIYQGEIRHKNARYPGQHAAIIEPELRAKVQDQLATNTVERRDGIRGGSASLLTSLLFDDQGHRMIPTHSRKGDRRYRYYVSKPLITQDQGKSPRGRRIPAGDIERIVASRLRQFLSNSGEVYDATGTSLDNPADRNSLIERAATLATAWTEIPRTRVRAILLALVLRVDIYAERIDIHVVPFRLVEILQGGHAQVPLASEAIDRDRTLTLPVPAQLKRVGMDVRFILDLHDPYDAQAKPDPALIMLLVKAHELREKLVHNGGQYLDVLAAREGITGSYFTRVVRLGWLAPDIVKAILEGRQPVSLTAAKLLRESRRFPCDWVTQRRGLEFE